MNCCECIYRKIKDADFHRACCHEDYIMLEIGEPLPADYFERKLNDDGIK